MNFFKVTSTVGLDIGNFISFSVMKPVVPCFFILAGWLFFPKIKKFDIQSYFTKLRSRCSTLMVPYFLWCLICLIIYYLKFKCFNLSGIDIFLQDGTVDIVNLLKGFWGVPSFHNMPYAYTFWFIRNLMVFVVLSPIAWIIIRSKILTCLFYIWYFFIGGVKLYGFEYFITGAAIAQYVDINKIIESFNRLNCCIALLLFISCLLLFTFGLVGIFYHVADLVRTLSFLYILFYLAKISEHNRLINTLCPASFMIYATQNVYMPIKIRLITPLIGYGEIFRPLAAYVIAFLTLTSLGFLTYKALRRISPRLLALLTGGRDESAI